MDYMYNIPERDRESDRGGFGENISNNSIILYILVMMIRFFFDIWLLILHTHTQSNKRDSCVYISYDLETILNDCVYVCTNGYRIQTYWKKNLNYNDFVFKRN